MRSEEVALFRAPPEAVWAVLADWERYAEWMPDVAWVRRIGPPDEPGPGLTLLVRTKVFGVAVAADRMRVTAWEPPSLLGIQHTGIVRGPAEWRLAPVESERTRFTWWEDITMPPRVVGELALRAYWPWQRRMFRRSIENLRHLVERP
jgi:carbon monoxide dehydrogenase subunit G